jgi:hypothetical protein
MQMFQSIQDGLSPSQVKAIRRREYYNRRVKPNFAPQNVNEIPKIMKLLNAEDYELDQPLTPGTRAKEESKLRQLQKLKEMK